ncbi:ubiquinone biosynthesis protein UbiH [Tamilnaduibacter salinus]|uniref:Ubiquinone biosynthesis protein UbiH n=1 Tax=Tamilnaduibacter salinus TaxID=1484056 RepID=A0A2A2I2Y0_9GAMM|nr:FAD-dependent monooxygenase [Tamilnaduibacter salinus]PAV25987.1 ubiquinone biosynthesis protein UbiH [Tamilnaduibacter salinus]
MTQQVDVIIVGAGMVGAALAAGLGQSGFEVALVDRQPPSDWLGEDAPDLRVSALSAGTETYLRRLGVWSAMADMRLTPYRRLAVRDDTRHPLSGLLPRARGETVFDSRDIGRPHLGHIVENAVTLQALQSAAMNAPGVTGYFGVSPDALAQTGKGAVLTLDDGSPIEGTLVVGADGAGSRVRDLAGIATHRDQYAQQALVASVRYDGPPQDITWQAFHPSGPRAFLPLHASQDGGSWASLVWYDHPETLSRLKQLDAEGFLAAVQSAFPDELPRLTALGGRGSFPLARQHAQRYHHRGVVLVGDAAHTINPLAGQGVNLGFQDAEALQSRLINARWQGLSLADTAILDDYEAERRPANRRMMLAMDVFYHAFSNRLPPLHLARNLGLALADRVPLAKQTVARYAMGIDERLPEPLARALEKLPGQRLSTH